MNHVTVGVYRNDDFVINIVPDEDLENHIAYNLFWRPGRAFFVDGVCKNKGYLSDDRIAEWAEAISKMSVDTNKVSETYL